MKRLLGVLGGMVWRIQVLASFCLLTVYPLLAILVVNGALFKSSQGSEILLDFWDANFMQDRLQFFPDAPRLYLLVVTVLFGLSIWSIARLLCDVPTMRTLSGFSRIRAENPDAWLLRCVGPACLAAAAMGPLLLVLVVDWSEESFTGTMARSQMHQVMFDRGARAIGAAIMAAIIVYIVLLPQARQLKRRVAEGFGVSDTARRGRRTLRATFLVLSAAVALLLLWHMPGTPFSEAANERSVHGVRRTYYVGPKLWLGIPLFLSVVVAYWCRLSARFLFTQELSRQPPDRMKRAPLVGVCASLVLASAVIGWIWVQPVEAAQRIGIVALLVSVGVFWSVTMSLTFVIVPQRLGGPSLAAVPVLLLFAFGSAVDKHELRSVATLPDPRTYFANNNLALSQCLQSERTETARKLDETLLAWLRDRIPKQIDSRQNVVVPLVVVASSGGGIRAAEFTAKALYEIDRRTKGQLGNHLFASSTVSGASLGIAVWAKARAIARANEELVAWNVIDGFFARDFFGPVVGGMLLHDAAQRLVPVSLPGASRGQILEDSWNMAWQDVLSSSKGAVGIGSAEGLGSLSELQNIEPPMMIFNATEVHSGRRFLISGAALSNAWHPDSYIAISRCSLHGTRDMSLATAIHLSARFTFLSPAASIVGAPDKWAWEAFLSREWETNIDSRDWPSVPRALWGQVVDGGYVENYGATTALETVRAIRESWIRIRADKRMPENVALHVLGLSLVNDPFDLGNRALDEEARINYSAYDLRAIVEGYDSDRWKVQREERRFESMWPVARSYDVRELRAMMGETTPIETLLGRSLLAIEVAVPVAAVLSTREARGLTVERLFADYLNGMKLAGGAQQNISGSWVDIRLGRLLRDENALRFSQPNGVPQTPMIGHGGYSEPNPQLAWRLSRRSRDSIWNALIAGQTEPGRYSQERDVEHAYRMFMSVCVASPVCATK